MNSPWGVAALGRSPNREAGFVAVAALQRRQVRLVITKTIGGTTKIATRRNQVIELIDGSKKRATRSLPPPNHKQDVERQRHGADRRPSGVVARPVEQVVLLRVAGDPGLEEGVQRHRGEDESRHHSRGHEMFQLIVQPKKFDSQLGIMRSAPSSQPMYQSGCEPAVTWSGVWGRMPKSG